MFQPDIEAMTQHVEHLFGGAPAGLVELAWTDTTPDDAGRYRLRHAQLFNTNNLPALVAEAARLNATPMCNVYIGAALRHPDTAPFGRTKDADAFALTAAYVDLDDPGTATAAKNIYGDNKPTLVVVTGREPHTRAQLWWRLDEPVTDTAQWPELLKVMSAAMDADTSVTNPARVMRLAGTVAWPVKPGRTVELTSIVPLREPGQSRYTMAALSAAFPATAAPVAAPAAPATPKLAASLNAAKPAADRSNFFRQANDLALRNTGAWVPAVFGSAAHFQTGTGAWRISSKELGRNLEEDLSIAPTGIVDFGVHDMGDARQGKRTPVDIVIEHGGAPDAKAAAFWLCEQIGVKPEAVGWQEAERTPDAPALPKPAVQDGIIKTTDFVTLLTEEVVEEPDYIEPGFAGPGMFVLIAGPPKAQKSFLLQEMLVAAATGASFLMDTFKCTRPLRVFYLQAEMNRKLLRKRAREFKLLSPDEKALLATNLIVSERFHMILNEGGVKTAVETIKAAFPDDPPDIIAIDPMANVFDQENENDSTQLMRFLTSRIEAIRQEVNPAACIVMVHHARKASAEDMARDPFVAIRGAGALRGYYDSAIVIFRTGEETKSRKVHFELRSGEPPEPMTVELENGRFITAGKAGSKIDKHIARRMLNALREAWDAGLPMSPNSQSKREGRFAVYNLSKQFEVPAKEVGTMLDEWMRLRVVAMRDRVSRGRPAGLEVIGSID
jgi:hypothetical protein